MVEISVLRAIPEIERQERQPEAFVLRDMPQLVTPHLRRWFEIRDDDVAEGDRAEAASGQNEVRQATIAHVEKAAVATTRTSERQQAEEVPDRIGMMRDEGSAEGQGIDATTSSTAARMRSRVVTAGSKCSVMSLSLRSASTDATPSIRRQPARMCSAQLWQMSSSTSTVTTSFALATTLMAGRPRATVLETGAPQAPRKSAQARNKQRPGRTP